MPRRCVVLVAAATLLATSTVFSLSTDTTATTHSFAQPHNFAAQRFLRTYTPYSNEERGIDFKSILGVDLKNVWTQQKLSHYLKKGKNGDDVFEKLKLQNVKAGKTIFENPKFLAWEQYVAKYNANPLNEEISMIATLSKHFDDDVLTKMIDAASKSSVAETKRIGATLQEQQILFWRSKKLAPDRVLKQLKLANDVDDLLTSPTFLTLSRYLDDYNAQNKMSLSMTEVLRRGFDEDDVAKMLQQAVLNAKDAKTKDLAVKLQNQQFDIWKKLGWNGDEIFTKLGLNQRGVTLENPNFAAWAKYVEKTTGNEKLPFNTLWKRYGEQTLATMLIADRKKLGGNDFVTSMQNHLIEKWLTMIRDPDDVAKILGTSFQGKILTASYRWNFKSAFG
ncbi:hypothetical protein F442_15867 [Phytophthora nicotianae P10297]|uniref:RxLR effector protein n=3 Tax=Phytophthora nicotianae TaxID=4792 RepID=W2YN85_PHYNI|nr:hypothetical protein F442_15867 [Phytophthora nicotianae P10297]